MSNQNEYTSKRDPALKLGFTIFIAVAIAAIGWIMMTVSSSPTTKGASFLWLPAALQMAAGVWLGPWYGFLAGGIGAYAAGVLAYGGWGIVDIINNLIAGGVANSMLPYFLFTLLKIDPTLGAHDPKEILTASIRAGILLVLVLAAGLTTIVINIPFPYGYLVPLAVLIIAGFFLMKDVRLSHRDFLLGFLVCVIVSAASAFIGVLGTTVSGVPFPVALANPGIGWFSGDLVSAVLGLYILALYTERLRLKGIAA